MRSLLILLLLLSPVHAQIEWEGENAGVSWITHGRSYTLIQVMPDGDFEGWDTAAFTQRLRPQIEAWHGASWSTEIDWDGLLILGTPGAASDLTVAPANLLRLFDFNGDLHDGDNYVLRHNLDRAFIKYSHPRFEVTLGRQAIGFGSARLFVAADLFSSVSPASLDTEFKRGVDAVRITVPLGENQEIETYVVFNGDDLENSPFLARWRGSLTGWDLSVMGGMTYLKPTIAVDASGDVWGAGWYTEASVRIADDSVFRGSAGLDTQLAKDVRGVIEFHYNGAGAVAQKEYLKRQETLSYRVGETTLLGQVYGGAALFYTITPTTDARLLTLLSIIDGSTLIAPGITWSLAEEISLGMSGLIPVGRRPHKIASGLPQIRSEFGSAPYLGFFDVQWAI